MAADRGTLTVWSWNTCKAAVRRQGPAIKKLHGVAREMTLLQEVPRIHRWRGSMAVYANAVASCAALLPPSLGSKVATTFSDSAFMAVVFSDRLMVMSVYLPDSGKTTYLFEQAVESLAACVRLARAQHRVRSLIVMGDWNVRLSSCGGGVMGPHWDDDVPYGERQDITMAFCTEFDLVHAPSQVEGLASDRWTREGWGRPVARAPLDHAFVSRHLEVSRWMPWPAAQWAREKASVWADHRPVMLTVQAEGHSRHVEVAPAISYTGWRLDAPERDMDELYRRLVEWARVFDSDQTRCADGLSRGLLVHCLALPYSTAAQRRAVHVPSPPELREVRRRRLLAPAGSAELQAIKRREKHLVRKWATQRLAVSGGFRRSRARDSWRSLSFIAFAKGEAPTSDRERWRQELRRHWRERFGDALDTADAQEAFRQLIWRSAEGCPPTLDMGEVVAALSMTKPGSAGGLDGPVGDMLLLLPWPVVCLVRRIFNQRMAGEAAGPITPDAWREFLATWIRKDRESDLLTSFRPIVQASVFCKWLERCITGPTPERQLLSRMPMWAFRPGASCDMLVLTVVGAVRSQLQFLAGGAEGEGVADYIYMTMDVEKAFDMMRMGVQHAALEAADLQPERAAALLSCQLGSEVHVRIGDTGVGPEAHSRGKQGGCSTPFAFSATMAMILAPCVERWRARGWGVPVWTLTPQGGGTTHIFNSALFADNVLIAGRPDQVAAMYAELTEELHRHHLRWKPSSLQLLGPSGHVQKLPEAGGHPAKLMEAQQQIPWLGYTLGYSGDWHVCHERAFEAASLAWHANHRQLYNRKISLRVRLKLYSQTAAGILVTRVAQFAITGSVLQRARRWENRCLRALTGLQRPCQTIAEFSQLTRLARKIAQKAGYVDVAELILTRHFNCAARWAEIRGGPEDLALQDFAHIWRAQFCRTRQALQLQGLRRAHAGRPQACWDSMLSDWRPDWEEAVADLRQRKAHCARWVAWGLLRAGLGQPREPAQPVPVARPVTEGDQIQDVPPYEDKFRGRTGVQILCDSLVVVRVVQGRWRPRQPWLMSMASRANRTVGMLDDAGLPPACIREGWWMAHISRTLNGCADRFAKQASTDMSPLKIQIFDREAFQKFQTPAARANLWLITIDGSTSTEGPHGKGPSGACACLWCGVSGGWSLTLVASTSSPWAAAVEAEAAACLMALAVRTVPLQHLMHELLDRCAPHWFTADQFLGAWSHASVA